MAEPQPPAIHEGAETPPAPAPAGGAAAASEAAALSSLDNKNLSGSDSSAAPKKEVDLKALNDAMKALGSGDGNSKKAAAAGSSSLKKASGAEEPAKMIKVEAADVGLLVRSFKYCYFCRFCSSCSACLFWHRLWRTRDSLSFHCCLLC